MSEIVKQSIVVKKSHPSVHNLTDAEKIARKYADKIYTSRETETSYRFRQRPITDCIENSYFTEVKEGGDVVIIMCRLKK